MTKEIGRFSKNAFEVVRACLNPYRGKDYLDIRILVQDKTGNLVPTRKGVCLDVCLIGELKDMLEKAEQAAQQGNSCTEGQ
jgi:hypothetical protein